MSNRALLHLLRPFEAHLSRPSVTEIVVNEVGRFGVEDAGVWSWHDDARLTLNHLDAIGVLAGFISSREFSPERPLCSATLPAGERIMCCRPPATHHDVISLTIRKPSQRIMLIDDDDFDVMFDGTNKHAPRGVSVDEELATLWRNENWKEFFRRAVQKRKSIGVCGPTGGGKTSFLRRLLMVIQPTDRIVTMEDTSEFGNAGPLNRVNLFFGEERANLKCDDTRRAALRMRPDRIIVQEIRGGEAMGFLQALASGHSGMTSWHANEGGEWEALAMMVRQHDAGRAVPPDEMYVFLKQFIDIIVWAAKEDRRYKVPRVWLKGVSEQ